MRGSTFLAGPHGGDWDRTAVAAVSAALIVAGVVLAVALLALRAWMKRRGSERAPCPGCGTFLAEGDACPVCPPHRSNREGNDASDPDAGEA